MATAKGGSVTISLLRSSSDGNAFVDGSCFAVSAISSRENRGVVDVSKAVSAVTSLWDGSRVVGLPPTSSSLPFPSFERSSREGATGCDLTSGSTFALFSEQQLERKSNYHESNKKRPNMILCRTTLYYLQLSIQFRVCKATRHPTPS